MTETARSRSTFLRSLREHVLTPVSTALSVVETEVEEVGAERRAFEQFRNRIAGIDTVSTSHSGPAPTTRTYEQRSRAVERVRTAFRETVMSVDHYDEMYGESLDEHVAAELSAEVAAGLQRETTPFSELYKTTLTSAADNAVEQREAFLDVLHDERDSLERAESALVDQLDTGEGPGVSAWDRPDFADRLDEIARQRQERVQQPVTTPRTNGHDLCTYLYRDREWTYPVLTAVSRFRTTVG